jgi:hypothetical protein
MAAAKDATGKYGRCGRTITRACGGIAIVTRPNGHTPAMAEQRRLTRARWSGQERVAASECGLHIGNERRAVRQPERDVVELNSGLALAPPALDAGFRRGAQARLIDRGVEAGRSA